MEKGGREMKFKYYDKIVMPTSTSTETTKHKLTLEVEGSVEEIEWCKKQLDKIGNEAGK